MRIFLTGLIAATLITTTGCEKPAPPAKPTATGATPATTARPADAAPVVIEPFNDKDLTGWAFDDTARPSNWVVGAASIDPDHRTQLKVEPGGTDLINPDGQACNPYTKQKFGDHRIELEVMLAVGSNSGIFVHGDYEVQVLDTLPADINHPTDMDHGAIARIAAPKIFTQKKPGEWQKYVIEFRAPRFDAAGKKTENARFIRIELNGQLIHENVEAPDTTLGGLTGEEHPTGPLYLQGNEGPVAFRNIKVTPLNLD
ncbi:MAG: DUF1080 domain-containing protein [Phycisphaera sp.]|nr:DUF1080 domain-containing protein [Phycisphaera sp.]